MIKPIFSDDGSWGKINSFFGFAVNRKYNIGGCPFSALLYIVSEYNKVVYCTAKNDFSVPLSYYDIVKKSKRDINTARQMIKTLLDEDLIKKVRIRKGRSKTLYIPNVKLLKRLVDDYLEDNPEDKA